ncbi:hypothetical protein Gogos_002071 [Gossypium gossypioides]|uniref:Reverse transcriptase Ty1/copia-type domain-containing protein n=1 Tax=Gossypium gossypioides TaxID=34282 RepID=A0A7J9CQQ4_GOSGO|nr:hypothetical protein [Gossypium gossypioides]
MPRDNVLQEVLKEKITFALWKKLEALYMTKSLANRLILKQHIYTFRMAKGKSIITHISLFFTLLNNLKNLKADTSDKDQAMLLYSLSSSYKTFRET